MKLVLPCSQPWMERSSIRCGINLTFVIDTQGDPSVGLQPSGLEDVRGDCPHVSAYNAILEAEGEEGFRFNFPGMSDAIDNWFKRQVEEEYEHERRMEAEYDARHPSQEGDW